MLAPSIDPVTHEIIQGKLLAIVDEMAAVMTRTSMSPVIYEVLDFACGICDSEAQLIAQTNGITLFTGTFTTQVRSIIERFENDLEPGDVVVTNDPYQGGTHACDLAIIRPIFAGEQLIAFAVSVAHWLDVGGAIPGSRPPAASGVFLLGWRLWASRTARRDTVIEDIVRIIRENVRLPELAIGDLNAQLATVRIADGRIGEIVEKYGTPTLLHSFRMVLRDSEEQSRDVVRSLPDGTYEAEDIVDGDGVYEGPIAIRVAVRIAGDEMEVDFTGCPPACDGPINCAKGALHSAVKTVFKALVSPHEPSNEGWFRPLKIKVPDGTLFSAQRPSPTGWYYEGSVHASELVWKALAPIMPDSFSAGSYTSLCVTYISGKTANGDLYVHIEPEHGGWGACRDRDGASALIALTDGDTYNYSIELIEAKFPLLVRRYSFNTEGGAGAGRYRGGYGLVREYEILSEEAEVYCGFGRSKTPPWSMDGGQPGSLNRLELETTSGQKALLGRSPTRRVNRGDVVRIVTGGGGGWGPPSERAIEKIEADIRAGLLTREQARAIYEFGARKIATKGNLVAS